MGGRDGGGAPARFLVRAKLPAVGHRVHFLAGDLVVTFSASIGSGSTRQLVGSDAQTGVLRWALASPEVPLHRDRYAIDSVGSYIAAARGDKPTCLSLWPLAADGAPVCGRVLVECKGEIGQVEVDHQGKELFLSVDDSAEQPRRIQAHSAESGSLLRTLEVPWPTTGKWGLKYHSPVAGKLAVNCHAEGDQCIFILDTRDGRLLCKADKFAGFRMAKWSCDGRRFATVDNGSRAWIWDATGEDQRAVLVRSLVPPIPNAQCVAFSPDGATAAVAGGNCCVYVFELLSGTCVQTFPGPSSYIEDLAFSPDGAAIAATACDLSTWVWHLDRTELFREIEAESSPRSGFAFSPDGAEIATCGEDRTPKRWDPVSGEQRAPLQGMAESALCCLAYSPDGARLATGCENGSLLLWDLAPAAAGPRCCGAFKHDGLVLAVVYGPKGTDRVATSSLDNTAQLWTSEGVPIRTLKGHTREIDALVFAPDGLLITGGRDSILKFWCPNTGDLKRTSEQNYYGGGWYRCISFAPSGDSFALSTGDRTQVFNVHSNRRTATLKAGDSNAFSPDGKCLVTVGRGSPNIALWDTQSWDETPVRTFGTGSCLGVVFSSRFPWLFATGQEKALQLFDTETTSASPTGAMLHERFLVDEAAGDFKRTADLLRDHSAALLLPIDFESGGRKSLVQRAMEGTKGVEFFLSIVVPSGSKEQDEEQQLAQQRVACAAFLQPRRAGAADRSETVLSFALENRSSPLVQEILTAYTFLLGREREEPPHPSREPRPLSEYIQLGEVLCALRQCPGMTLDFLETVRPAPHAPGTVLGNRQRFEFPGNESLICGSRERSPHAFWGDGTEGAPAESQPLAGTGKDQGSYVEAKVIPLKGVAAPKAGGTTFLEAVVDACTLRGVYGVMQSELVQTVIDFKWNSYGRRAFRRALVIEVLYVVSFTTAVLSLPSLVVEGSPYWAAYVLFLAALLLWAFRVCKELRQLCASSPRGYFLEDIWNPIDAVALAIAGLSLGSFIAGALQGEHLFLSDAATAIAMPFVYFKLLYYFQGTAQGGILVRIVLSITARLWRFSVIMFICMAGFTFSFFVLFRKSADIPWGYGTVPMTALITYDYILGDFGPQDFEQSGSFSLAVALFVVFMYFVYIVLLNLLISIMGDLYDEVQETATAQYLHMKSKLVLEYEAEKTPSPAMFPDWLQVLSAEDEDQQTLWSGRVAYVKDHLGRLKHEVNKIVTRVSQSEATMKERMARLEERQGASQRLMLKKQADLERKLDAVLRKLDPVGSI